MSGDAAPKGLTALQVSRLTAAQTQLGFASTGVTGVTIPRADRWIPGSSWTTIYDVDGDPGSGGNLARGRIAISNTIVGEESVSVPAGKFQALKVKQQSTIDLTVIAREFSAPLNISIESTSWFVRDVGMVKSIGGGELGDTTTELTAFIP
jgi:DUF3108-like